MTSFAVVTRPAVYCRIRPRLVRGPLWQEAREEGKFGDFGEHHAHANGQGAAQDLSHAAVAPDEQAPERLGARVKQRFRYLDAGKQRQGR